MAKSKDKLSEEPVRRSRPALTPEARENQLIALAVDLAEQQLRDGTASSQVITHYLKLGSTREKLEQEMIQKQKEMVEAKTKSYASSDEIKQLYKEAISAFRVYAGQGEQPDEGL